ncbi:hypothetical protein C1646_813751 [Rhizophagus diaphanus]|nr:hypothetical protein C1646_813751 [Rhizophagus diaphanus] [Rhizophagus sp. MUCL 43196]
MFNERSYHPNGINFELQKDESDVIDKCYMVCPNNTRFDECSLLHKAGNHVVKGIIKKKTDSCPVKFYHIIPENLRGIPFIVTISVGKFNHSPPPPHNTTIQYKKSTSKIIDN